MELQVQFWATNSELGKKCKYYDQPTFELWPALSAKSMISFCLNAKLYKLTYNVLERLEPWSERRREEECW